jgi:RHS repeat-associated protein
VFPLASRGLAKRIVGAAEASWLIMPIDIATGDVGLGEDDFVLPGRVAIKWTRRYRSALLGITGSPLGPGWTTSWLPTLKRVEQTWEFLNSEGVLDTFPDPEGRLERGQVIRLLGAFLELIREGNRYIVTQWNVESGEIQRFVFAGERGTGALPLVAVENVNGDGVEVLWEAPGQLKSLRQRIENRTIQVNYSPTGRIISLVLVTKEGTRRELVRYEYDAIGRLSAVFDRKGFANRYEYDVHSRLTREILKDGAVYSYRYDEKGRCVHFSGLDRYDEKRLKFIDAANRTLVTNSYGKTTVLERLPSGQIAGEVDPAGNQRRTVFDEYGRTIAKVDPTGATIRYTYDERGNRDSMTDPLGHAYRVTFNAHHQPVSLTDPLGKVWFREYDAKHRLVATLDPLGARWTTHYDAAGNPVGNTDPLGSRRSQRFADGMLQERTDWMGHVTHFKWDEFGRVIERVGPVGERTAVAYDPVGNPVDVQLPDGGRLRFAYDSGGNISSFTNAKGYTTHLRFGPCSRLLECVDAIGRVLRFNWGTERERLDACINEKGETLSFFRDDQGRIVSERSFDGREQFFDFDGAGRLIAFTNGNGEKILLKRDAAGRRTERTLPDGTVTKFEYDAIGRILKAINPDAAVAFEYDAAGRLIREWQGQDWVRTDYNAANDVIGARTSLGHEVRYELDPNGRALKLFTGNNYTLAFERDARGLETGRQMPRGVRLEQRFDSMGRIVEQRVGRTMTSDWSGSYSSREFQIPAGDEMVKRGYRYDSDGLLLSIEDGRWGMTDYAYDPAERLLSALRDQGLNERFEYDAADNLTRSQEQGRDSSDHSCAYGPGNRLLRRGDTRYEYDSEGRLVRKTEFATREKPQVWVYTWDAQGQLRKLLRPDGAEWDYKYDAFGRRIAKLGPKSARLFFWNGDVVIHERHNGDQPTAWLMERGSFAPLAKIQNGALFAIINDRLGTPNEMLDDSGKLVWAASFAAWGRVDRIRASLPENDCPIRFQGQWFDEESGLHYNRFRYYDPTCGRFIQQDPVKLLGAPNFYSYPNPVNSIDPWGLSECHESGERGRAKALKDLKKAGFTIVDEEVTMLVGGQRIRADFVAEGPNGRLYVFEVKNGTGGLTNNQEKSEVFNIDNPANQNGAIRTSGGSDPPGRRDTFEVATGSPNNVGDRGDTGTATFAVLKYDGTPGSRVQ